MSKLKVRVLAGGFLLIGLFVGAAAAQIVESFQEEILRTGLFTVGNGQTAYAHVSLDEAAGASPANALIQLIDQTGAVIVQQQRTLQPGETVTIRTPRPGTYRVRADLTSSTLRLTSRRGTVGTVEVIDDITAAVRFVCSFDPRGVPAGRD